MDAAAEPDDGVIVDVVFEDGVLYLELANLAARPALRVTCTFEPPLVDAAGRDVSKLRLFRKMEFLGPERRVRTLLDSLPGYFGRKAPARVVVTVTYARPGSAKPCDDDGHTRSRGLPRDRVSHVNRTESPRLRSWRDRGRRGLGRSARRAIRSPRWSGT